jgi:hypothetical protein
MDRNLAELLHDWHDFYALIGTAAATLIGLMFVAASIASPYLTEKNRAAIQAFFTPTVAHFVAVLMICVLLSAPMRKWTVLGVLVLGIGLAGVSYASTVWVRMGRGGFTTTIDLADRFWYALAPLCGHFLTMASGTLALLMRGERSLHILGAASVLLLLAGIRNAWDITAWVVMRSGRSD